MSAHCPGCGAYTEEDDARLCGRCDADASWDSWWSELTKRGDPLHRPFLVKDAFRAGFRAGQALSDKQKNGGPR